jgi:hypothetical protein
VSPLVLRLRQRIDVLSDRLAAANARANGGGKAKRRCVYCGRECRSLACVSHRDLLTLDPHYAEAR